MAEIACRACRGTAGELVLDLGAQPACDHFPAVEDPGPDPTYPLQMWLCATCGLAQLLVDPTVPAEPKGAEPAALVAQARDAVERVDEAGWLRPGATVLEYGSPHGGSWLDLLLDRGLAVASDGDRADVILDCFGLMHCADQAAAVAERAARLAPGGVLLIQYHSLATILERGQWNSLRHGHYAYYSATALAAMLAAVGLTLRSAWTFDLYGGTVLLAVTAGGEPGDTITSLFAAEQRAGVRDPRVGRELEAAATASAEGLREWLTRAKRNDRRVFGYAAASRAVALLCRAGVTSDLLPAIADASPAKRGTRMPGTDIPVITPDRLVGERPDEVLLLLPDLLTEVRSALPGIESAGGGWVDVETIGTMSETEESTAS